MGLGLPERNLLQETTHYTEVTQLTSLLSTTSTYSIGYFVLSKGSNLVDSAASSMARNTHQKLSGAQIASHEVHNTTCHASADPLTFEEQIAYWSARSAQEAAMGGGEALADLTFDDGTPLLESCETMGPANAQLPLLQRRTQADDMSDGDDDMSDDPPCGSHRAQVAEGLGISGKYYPTIMTMGLTAERHREWIKELKEMHRTYTIKLAAEANGKFGFQIHELHQQYALSFPPGLQSTSVTLTSLQVEFFGLDTSNDAFGRELYDFNLPMRQLVTRLLTHPSCTLFFQNVLFAPREQSTTLGPGGVPVDIERVPAMSHWNKRNHYSYLGTLLNLMRRTQVIFDTTTALTDGSSFASTTLRYEDDDDDFASPTGILIKLNMDFYTAAKAMLAQPCLDMAQAMRYWFFLAITLAHEVGHALEYWLRPNTDLEPLYGRNLGWREGETGAMFEIIVFGGKVNPINDSCDCRYGLATFPWTTRPTEWKEHRSIPMTVVAQFFQESNWNVPFSGTADECKRWWLPGSRGPEDAQKHPVARGWGRNIVDIF